MTPECALVTQAPRAAPAGPTILVATSGPAAPRPTAESPTVRGRAWGLGGLAVVSTGTLLHWQSGGGISNRELAPIRRTETPS